MKRLLANFMDGLKASVSPIYTRDWNTLIHLDLQSWAIPLALGIIAYFNAYLAGIPIQLLLLLPIGPIILNQRKGLAGRIGMGLGESVGFGVLVVGISTFIGGGTEIVEFMLSAPILVLGYGATVSMVSTGIMRVFWK